MATKTCTRLGCGQQFDPAVNNTSDCVFHPGHPVFHEGLKSWSCCKDVNKPVLEFDQFTKIQGCATGTHSLEKPTAPTAPTNAGTKPKIDATKSIGSNGTETYSSNGQIPLPAPTSRQTTTDVFKPMKAPDKPAPKAPVPEVEDDEESVVSGGTICKRLACGQEWTGEAGAKRGKLIRDECTYHPGTPIFHEGSKGYSCCKKRVLDFDDFLKMPGCKQGSHLFIGVTKSSDEEELVECRFDYYQTPNSVIVSIFGKGAVKEASIVTFDEQAMNVDLKLPANKRFKKTFKLFGSIDIAQSTYKILSTKCEIVLVKFDGRSWSNLEQGDTFAGTVTFGVGGRTGTIGAKKIAI